MTRSVAGLALVLLVVVSLAAGPAAAQEPPAVAKVDPPSWWTGSTMNPVRLLVRGTGRSRTHRQRG